jgi:hypothetical protein
MLPPEPRVDPARLRALRYVRPRPGRDYWVLDRVLADPDATRSRALARTDFDLGFPHRRESWPGMRATGALTREELAPLERKVRQATGARSLFQVEPPPGARLDHNILQIVGAGESGPRPHTDSRKICRYAAVLYLHPDPPAGTGTTFFRLRFPDGTLGGNTVEAPHANLPEALGVRAIPLDAWAPDVTVDNVFNRLLVYRGNLCHSAARYFGGELAEKRMTAVFFWMARDG